MCIMKIISIIFIIGKVNQYYDFPDVAKEDYE